MSHRGRIHRAPLALAAFCTVVVGVGGGAGVYLAEGRTESRVQRIEDAGIEDVLAANDTPAENYLLIGSDNRDVIDPNSPDAGLFLEGDTGEGGRSDTIMILRRDPDNGATLLSIPRDLWVTIAETGEGGKITWAYIGGAGRLAATISQELAIPIHHVIEIDFAGFHRLIDEIGGVEVCVDFAVRDLGSGLALQPGCQALAGGMALAYARSRSYEEFREGDWVPDNQYDFGRIARQQHLLRLAASKVLDQIQSNPFRLGDLLDVAVQAVRIDGSVDPSEAGQALFAAYQTGLHTYTVPTVQEFIGDQDAQVLADNADEVLDYFRGTGPLPPESTQADG
jgi:LCP family protein required for cell wall assembly